MLICRARPSSLASRYSHERLGYDAYHQGTHCHEYMAPKAQVISKYGQNIKDDFFS